MLNLQPPPGFNGLALDEPIQYYFRKLPHWRQDGATYFVTFRLGDSLPQSKLKELREFRDAVLQQYGEHPSRDQAEKLAKEVMRRVEKWLDQGIGQCHFRKPEFANEMATSMNFFNGKRYELDCFVVMPNHVHAILKPLHPSDQSLETILHSWKRHVANTIHKCLAIKGNFFQAESFDRIIRDEEHLYRAIQYIGNNPLLANLNPNEYSLWIRPDWKLLGWGFRDH